MSFTLQFHPKRTGLLIKRMPIALLLLAPLSNAVAQKTFIKGKLVNDKDEPVAFATIVIKGIKTGVETDSAGKFSLAVTRIPVTIQCAAIGYSIVEKKIAEKDFKDSVAWVTITINAVENKLEAVVVTGYATSKRMSMTGSVATVSSRILEERASG